MTPNDVCRKCDGMGLLVNIDKMGLLRMPYVVPCPVCEGVGWDPEAIKRELQQHRSALENVKL